MVTKTPVFRRDEQGIRDLINFLIQEKAMTLAQIGRAVGKSESMVWRWQRGVVPRGPTWEQLKNLLSGEVSGHGKGVPSGVPSNILEVGMSLGRLESAINTLSQAQREMMRRLEQLEEKVFKSENL